MSLITLTNILLATTPEEKAAAQAAHAADLASRPSDSEIITGFLKQCTNAEGKPVLDREQRAEIRDGSISVVKSH
ncbi:hypothetical protein DDO73_17600 [Vibrio cholerae]|uniref:Uncharacterized protein n=1 Tax=Vibrio cholerae TaxID=666 RepID=A0ABD7SSI4_VIBCL|nr:hypothetical protein [Vibrio cholerae]EGR4074873.1 hypothetical protein [Vibrio cholerae]MBY4642012.1 hypothetical protein [Vibrio cholerae]MCR9658284.1 hypothetical protein [Vibrio cholerae]MCR9688965.1 hypothetical protein [Vibrio cholerae]MCR9737473.1 hypothetical protein [Vibrio cholerae]